eukprot:763695-Hanusia_phi.AAC.9
MTPFTPFSLAGAPGPGPRSTVDNTEKLISTSHSPARRQGIGGDGASYRADDDEKVRGREVQERGEGEYRIMRARRQEEEEEEHEKEDRGEG